MTKTRIEERVGIFSHITNRFPSGLIIGRLEDGSTIKGVIDDGEELIEGVAYRFMGRVDNHPKWGYQFWFSSFVTETPHTRQSVVKYLMTFADGVGVVKAQELWAKFGADSVRVLAEEPARVVEAGILSPERVAEASEVLRGMEATRATRIDLMGLLDGKGFPKKIVSQLIKKFGASAARDVRDDPYLLLRHFKGAGFLRTDKLYLDLKHDPASLPRQMYCIWHHLRSSTEGHTWHAIDAAVQALRDSVSGAQLRPTKAIELGIREEHLAVWKGEIVKDGWVAEAAKAANELVVAEEVKRLLGVTGSLWPSHHALSDRLTPHQREQLGLALRLPISILIGTPGTGKATTLDTPVLTPTGWKPMGCVSVGDQVIGGDGFPCFVEAVYPQGNKEVYRVTFSDGAFVECCSDHLWLTQTRSSRKNAMRSGRQLFHAGKVRSTAEVAATLKSSDGQPNHYIPMVGPVRFEANDTPLHPYLMGVLLGNGCFRGDSVIVSLESDEMVQALACVLPANCEVVPTTTPGNYRVRGTRYGNNPVLNCVRALGLHGKKSVEKFAPDVYKFNSVECRLAVLQGLLDTDGYTNGRHVEYTSSSPALASDVRFLIESLGGTGVTNWKKEPIYNYRGEERVGMPSARISVSLPPAFPPFRLTRKKSAYIPRTKYMPSRSVVSVEFVGERPAQCITVDSPDGLYVTDFCVVTHNTFCAAAVAAALCRSLGPSSVAACAPTGKAAVRLTQKFREYEVPLAATTIHRLLKVGPSDDGYTFAFTKACPLEQKVFILDEASMVDSDLFAHFLSALPPAAHLLLVGDPNQLTPVGHGAPLRDMLAVAALPRGELREIKRNAGLIVQACRSIKDGEPYATCARYEPDKGLNLRHVPCGTPEAAVEALESLLAAVRGGRRWDVFDDVQVIVAVNDKSPLARKKLNGVLQNLLNPAGRTAGQNPFRVGDKTLCLRNGLNIPLAGLKSDSEVGFVDQPGWKGRLWFKDADGVEWCDLPNAKKTVFVANGEIGRVCAVDERITVMRFRDPDRVIKVPMGRQEEDEDGEEKGRGCNYDLGFVVTGHRMQGSECPVAIVLIDDYPGASYVCSSNWWYTSLSRASELCVTIGRQATVEKHCRRVATDEPKTFLKQLLAELLEPLPRETEKTRRGKKACEG
jgi:hypothetical protein